MTGAAEKGVGLCGGHEENGLCRPVLQADRQIKGVHNQQDGDSDKGGAASVH